MQQNWQLSLNNCFTGSFELLSLLEEPPHLQECGEFEPPQDLHANIRSLRDILSQPNRFNELQALVVGEPNINAEPVQIRYQLLDYATARVMRECDQAEQIVSTSVLPVCPAKNQIVLHKRSLSTELLPGKLHTFSGAWQPPNSRSNETRETEILQSALRELYEETGVKMAATRGTGSALFRDLKWGATEYCLLGIEVSEMQCGAMSDTEEGEIVFVHFDDLYQSLEDTKGLWTDGGRAEVLTWLALNAPPIGSSATFCGKTAKATFQTLMGRIRNKINV